MEVEDQLANMVKEGLKGVAACTPGRCPDVFMFRVVLDPKDKRVGGFRCTLLEDHPGQHTCKAGEAILRWPPDDPTIE